MNAYDSLRLALKLVEDARRRLPPPSYSDLAMSMLRAEKALDEAISRTPEGQIEEGLDDLEHLGDDVDITEPVVIKYRK